MYKPIPDEYPSSYLVAGITYIKLSFAFHYKHKKKLHKTLCAAIKTTDPSFAISKHHPHRPQPVHCHPPILHPIALQWSQMGRRALIQQNIKIMIVTILLPVIYNSVTNRYEWL